jgi:hypothetical protein
MDGEIPQKRVTFRVLPINNRSLPQTADRCKIVQQFISNVLLSDPGMQTNPEWVKKTLEAQNKIVEIQREIEENLKAKVR